MDITKDKDVYLLSKVLGELETEQAGADFLRDYWQATGRLRLVEKLLGGSFAFSPEEAQYVLSVESLCERLVAALNGFLRPPYCGAGGGACDPQAEPTALELLVALENLQSADIAYGWSSLFERLSAALSNIEVIISRLTVMHSTGKRVSFSTNAVAEDFLQAKQMDFRRQSGKYFILKH
jgi:hypothetical protein